MKMENELRSPRAGTVVDVRVAEGARVESQALLVVVG
jgi:biotin carboxyl carrier protein